MKKYFCTFCFALFISCSFAQPKNINSILIRHDTSLLKADECEWIVKSLTKNDPSLNMVIGKSIPLIILETIEKGRLKAIDPRTNKPIPAKEIFTWKMAKDSMMTPDSSGEYTKVIVVQQHMNPDKISQIRIYQDWYFNISTGRFEGIIKLIELMAEVHTSSGLFLGMTSFCRINY